MLIKDLRVIFGSNTKSQEILLLLDNAKPVVRQGFYPHEIAPVQDFCHKNNLHAVQSKFKVVIPEQGFHDAGMRVEEKDGRLGMYFWYISKNELHAYKASLAELTLHHKELGEHLDYPPCCIQYFIENFSSDKANLQVKPTNPWTNLSRRESDFVLLSHFPCSSDCQLSITLAQKYYNKIKKNDPHYATTLLQNLQCRPE